MKDKLKIEFDIKKATAKIERLTKAVNRLNEEIKKLNDQQIDIKVTNVNDEQFSPNFYYQPPDYSGVEVTFVNDDQSE